MKKPQLMAARAKTIFALACFFFACYFTATQFALFCENRDSSSIAYKPFNLSPTDKYPTFSICLKGHHIYWQNEKNLFGREVLQFGREVKYSAQMQQIRKNVFHFLQCLISVNIILNL